MDQIADLIVTSPVLWFFLMLLPFVLVFLFSRMKLKQTPIAEQITITNGYRVSLFSSHRALKIAPLFTTFARNQLWPKLLLFNDHIEFTVLILTSRRMVDIEMIDIAPSFGTQSLVINFKGNPICFIGYIINLGHLRAVVQFFQEKHVPLSLRAQKFLRNPV